MGPLCASVTQREAADAPYKAPCASVTGLGETVDGMYSGACALNKY